MPFTASSDNVNNQTSPPRSKTTVLIASVLVLLAAITVAIFIEDTSTDGLFGLRRLFGGGIAGPSSRAPPLRHHQTSPTSALSGSFAARDEVRANMRTPIYFLSHGGVCVNLTLDLFQENLLLIDY